MRRAGGKTLRIPGKDLDRGADISPSTGPHEYLEQPGPEKACSTGDEQASPIQ